MLKRLTHTGSTLRAAHASPRRRASPGALEEQVWPLLAPGAMKPVIHATFPLARPPRRTP